MKNKPLKMAALISGSILLIILLFVQYFEREGIESSIKPEEKETAPDIMMDELLRIEPEAGQDANDIRVEYDIINNKLNITIPNIADEYDIDKVDYGSPYVEKITYMATSKKVNLTVALKEYCSYTKNIVGNKVYIHFESLKDSENPIIFIDPGHGGEDVGAQNGEIYEKNINLEVAVQVKNILANMGYTPVLTRENDTFVTVEERTDIVNKIKPMMLVSIHCNDSEVKADGTEVLYNSKDKNKYGSKWLAKILRDSVVKEAGTTKRDIINGNSIHVVRNSKVTAALVEMGFMSDESDMKLLVSKSGQNKFARGIANGIIEAVTQLEMNGEKDG